MLKQGVPAVVLVHAHFARLAQSLFRQLGVDQDPALLIVGYPADRPSSETPEELHDKAVAVIDRLAGMLTAQRAQPAEGAGS
jgi:hypothetical protein